MIPYEVWDSVNNVCRCQGRKKESPKNTQPKKKKRRVKSKTDAVNNVNKGHNDSSTNLYAIPSSRKMANTAQGQQVQYPPPPSQPMSFQNSMQSPMPNPSQAQPPMHMEMPPMPFSYSPSQLPNPQSSASCKPDWAIEILDGMKEMKRELTKLGSIEKTLSTLTLKINQLENKVPSMETVVSNFEKSSEVLSKSYDSQSKELKYAQDDIKTLRKQCESFEKHVEEQNMSNSKLESKITDLEARSMRENLLFHGIPETPNENCEVKVKEYMVSQLNLDENSVNSMNLDRVHRIGRGPRGPGFTRPIVA